MAKRKVRVRYDKKTGLVVVEHINDNVVDDTFKFTRAQARWIGMSMRDVACGVKSRTIRLPSD